MKDLQIDRSMDLAIGSNGDLDSVRERAEFHQQIAVYLQIYLYDKIGRYNTDELRALIRMNVKDVAADYNQLQSIERIRISRSTELPNAIELVVLYETGETFERVIS
jgi:hypothetical protein